LFAIGLIIIVVTLPYESLAKKIRESKLREQFIANIQVIKIRIIEIIWLDNIVEKIRNKHNVTVAEVEEVFRNKTKLFDVDRKEIMLKRIYFMLLEEQMEIVCYSLSSSSRGTTKH